MLQINFTTLLDFSFALFTALQMGLESVGQFGANGRSLWNAFVAIFSVQSEVGDIPGWRPIPLYAR